MSIGENIPSTLFDGTRMLIATECVNSCNVIIIIITWGMKKNGAVCSLPCYGKETYTFRYCLYVIENICSTYRYLGSSDEERRRIRGHFWWAAVVIGYCSCFYHFTTTTMRCWSRSSTSSNKVPTGWMDTFRCVYTHVSSLQNVLQKSQRERFDQGGSNLEECLST